MSPKKRITRQEMKEDQFVTMVFKAREWAELNLNTIIIGVGAIVLVIAGIWYLTTRSESRNQEAYDLLGQAEMEVRNNQPQLAIVDFQRILDDYSGAEAARLASLGLANLYFAQNDFEKAEPAFRDFLKDYCNDEQARFSAEEGIAGSLSGQRKFAEAGEAYLNVAKSNPDVVTYEHDLFYAVESYIKAGDEQGAREAFALLEEQGITSEMFRSAKIMMIENGFLAYEKGDYK